jgi:hypothetical protein
LHPFFILSVFNLPIAGAPQALQWLAYLNLPRCRLIIIRG